MFRAGRRSGQVDATMFGLDGASPPGHILLLVFTRGIGRRLEFLRTLSIFQANPSSRVPSCQGVSAESGGGHAGRVNFDWHSPGASAHSPGESVSAGAGNVAGMGRLGKPRPAFALGCLATVLYFSSGLIFSTSPLLKG